MHEKLKKRCAQLLVAGGILLAPLACSGGLDPHIPPGDCPSCHTRVPTAEEIRAGRLFLLGDTIDATCHLCHARGCCQPGNLHGPNHPTNINTWDRKKFQRPRTLPLFKGYITCNTCHAHLVNGNPVVYMLRKVDMSRGNPDWSALCLDCHVGYDAGSR